MNQEEQKFYDENGYVICQYCLKPFKTITPGHLKFHDMTTNDYRERFPNAPFKWLGHNETHSKNKKQNIDTKIEWDTTSSLTKNNAFLILKEKYPNIQKNYIFKKLNSDGHILFTFHVDFGDPSKRLLIDFEGMGWHAKTPLFTKYRKKELAGQSKWKYINFENEFENMEDFINYLK